MLLLDTHVLLWYALEEEGKLGRRAYSMMDRAWDRDNVAVSALTFWEVSMHQNYGKIVLPTDASAWCRSLRSSGLRILDVTDEIAIQAGLLPNLHGDPADRVILATAIHEKHTLVTADEKLLAWYGYADRVDARD